VSRSPTFIELYEGHAPIPPMAVLIGWRTLEFDPEIGFIRGEMIAPAEFLNSYGTVQGGALCMLLDQCVGLAALCALGPGQSAPTMELKTSFMRPVGAGKLVGEGRVVFRAAGIYFAEAKLETLDRRLVATASATMRVLTTR